MCKYKYLCFHWEQSEREKFTGVGYGVEEGLGGLPWGVESLRVKSLAARGCFIPISAFNDSIIN